MSASRGGPATRSFQAVAAAHKACAREQAVGSLGRVGLEEEDPLALGEEDLVPPESDLFGIEGRALSKELGHAVLRSFDERKDEDGSTRGALVRELERREMVS